MKLNCFSFLFYSLLCFVFLAISCTSLTHDPLIDQELRARPGFAGLTNTTCRSIFFGVCSHQDVLVYSFGDEATLKRLRAVKLICKVGEKRFHICGDKPALCSNSYEAKSFLGVAYTTKIVTEILYIPEDLDTLIDAKAYCAAQGSESEKGMF